MNEAKRFVGYCQARIDIGGWDAPTVAFCGLSHEHPGLHSASGSTRRLVGDDTRQWAWSLTWADVPAETVQGEACEGGCEPRTTAECAAERVRAKRSARSEQAVCAYCGRSLDQQEEHRYVSVVMDGTKRVRPVHEPCWEARHATEAPTR